MEFTPHFQLCALATVSASPYIAVADNTNAQCAMYFGHNPITWDIFVAAHYMHVNFKPCPLPCAHIYAGTLYASWSEFKSCLCPKQFHSHDHGFKYNILLKEHQYKYLSEGTLTQNNGLAGRPENALSSQAKGVGGHCICQCVREGKGKRSAKATVLFSTATWVSCSATLRRNL